MCKLFSSEVAERDGIARGEPVRRLRVRQGLSGREAVSRREDRTNLRRHVEPAASDDCQADSGMTFHCHGHGGRGPRRARLRGGVPAATCSPTTRATLSRRAVVHPSRHRSAGGRRRAGDAHVAPPPAPASGAVEPRGRNGQVHRRTAAQLRPRAADRRRDATASSRRCAVRRRARSSRCAPTWTACPSGRRPVCRLPASQWVSSRTAPCPSCTRAVTTRTWRCCSPPRRSWPTCGRSCAAR